MKQVREQLSLVSKYAKFLDDSSLAKLLENLKHSAEENSHTIEFRFSEVEAKRYLTARMVRDIAMSQDHKILRKTAIDEHLDVWISLVIEENNHNNLTIDRMRGLRSEIFEMYNKFCSHMLEN